jgi:ribonuclease R
MPVEGGIPPCHSGSSGLMSGFESAIITAMSKTTIDDIIEAIGNSPRPLRIRELSRRMGVKSDEYPGFRRIVKGGVAEGRLAKIRGGRLVLPSKEDLVTGKLFVSRAGHGFVIPDDQTGDIFVSSRDLGGAIHGEQVKVMIKSFRKGRSREGNIVGVMEREKGRLVGRLREGRHGLTLTPDDPRVQTTVEVENPKNLAIENDMVVTIRLFPWEATFLPPRGKIEEVLGMAGSPGIDIDSLIIAHGLPREFDPRIKKELASIRSTLPKAELSGRLDLRDVLTFTIDPADAKDHDDAISLEPLPDGLFRLGVHIADVSHYIESESGLDSEALLRGNSVYLVDRVIPMLPERLSGDICSLHEKKDRLTLSFIASIDESARVRKWEFKESIIRSSASLTYEQVQEYLDGGDDDGIDSQTGKVLKGMLRIAGALRSERLKKGSLDFDLPEPHVLLDPEGRVLDIFTRARMPSHQIVEEFMLLANKYAAGFLQGAGAPMLYRVHARPEKEKIENFAELLQEMGYNFSFRGEITPKKLQRILEKIQGRPEEQFVEEIMLRSLAKAAYQPDNIGHFGLAFDSYTHFTSPIRRYPDLLVHRVMKLLLKRRLSPDYISMLKSSLKQIGSHCTATEIAADEAERESVKIKQLEFLSERVGGVYEGIISGVVKSGFFVELLGSMVEGFVPYASLDDDYFTLEEGKHRAIGKRSKKVFRLGDKARVVVARVELDQRRAEFVLVQDEVTGKRSRAARKKRRR